MFYYFRAFKELIRLKEAVRVSPGLLGWNSDKESACTCRRHRFDAWVRKIPRAKNANPFQYSWLENFMNGGAWWANVHGVAKSWTRLSDRAHIHTKWALMQSDWCPSKKKKFRQTRRGTRVLAHRGTSMWRHDQMLAKEKGLKRKQTGHNTSFLTLCRRQEE